MAQDSYLPINFVEALGRATVARHQANLSFNILIAILAREPSRLGIIDCREPFEAKVAYLVTIPGSRLLKHEWRQRTKQLARRAKEQDQDYANAAVGSVYSRGAGSLENELRLLSERAGVSPMIPAMTPDKLDKVAAEFRIIAWETCHLATSLLKAAANLAILPAQDEATE